MLPTLSRDDTYVSGWQLVENKNTNIVFVIIDKLLKTNKNE